MFAVNWFGRETYEVIAPELPAGAVALRWEFIYDGGKMPGAGGRGDFFIDGEQVASGRIERTIRSLSAPSRQTWAWTI